MKPQSTEEEIEREDEAFLRSLIRPEEERRRYSTAPCGVRWFRSKNVIPIEKYRSRPKPE
jgi:hypothetical protein